MGISKKKTAINLTEGPIVKNILLFAAPLFLGQLLQQFYNMVDAWVIGNFADNDAFAAVSSAGSMTFLIVGLFNGIAIGGGVIISKYFGAKDQENVVKAIHTNFLFGIMASIASTVVGLLLMPHILVWMKTPESVMQNSLSYFTIYFAGVSTVIMYNICMSIMRALGDSVHPLYYLIISSVINVVLDLLFVAVFKWGVAGAAIATVIAQAISVILCLWRMCRIDDYTRLDFRKLHFYRDMMLEVIKQGLPTGVQNAVISIGNLTIASALITWDIFRYYMTTSNNSRKIDSGPFPYIRVELDREQRKVFQTTYTKVIDILDNFTDIKIVPVYEMDLLLYEKFKFEKQIKSSNIKFNHVALGVGLILENSDMDIKEISNAFYINESKVKKEIKNIDTIKNPRSDKSKKFLDLIKK